MHIVTLEEHVVFQDIHQQYFPERTMEGSMNRSPVLQQYGELLYDIERVRLHDMNEHGITMQVLSVIERGAESLAPTAGKAYASACNDRMAITIASHPDRFSAFAHLPMTDPEAAARELERAVKEYGFKGAMINGMTDGAFLDDPIFAPVLEKAVTLGVPLYLHPAPPPQAVWDAYFSHLPKSAGTVMAMSGWGWHSETAIHVLRLILSGTLDRYPQLQLIIGHTGEMLPMMMARCDDKFKVAAAGINQRSVSRTLREQVAITTSGMFTLPPLQLAIELFSIDQVLFSIDYPFSTIAKGRQFLDELPLEAKDKLKLAGENANRVLGN